MTELWTFLDGKKTPCWPHKPSLLIDQSQVEKQITRHTPTACSQRVLSAHLIFEVCQTKDKHLPSILQFTRTKPTKVLPNTIPVQIRNQLRTRTNQNVEMLWKFREMKKILCISNKSDLMQFESQWKFDMTFKVYRHDSQKTRVSTPQFHNVMVWAGMWQ